MVKIKDLLPDELVLEEITAVDKRGVLREFAVHLESKGRIGNAQELVRVLEEREALGSTGIGDGIAIPHGKLTQIPDMIVAFGRSSRGIDFQALDHKPVHLFFLLVTPLDRPGEHLKTLARISRILRNPGFRDNLMHAQGREALQRLIGEEDGKYPQR